MASVDDLLNSLELTPTAADAYKADNVDAGHGVVFGGQLLAQSIVAALEGHEDKRAKTVHTVFARAGSPSAPVEINVDRMHAGRAFASSSVTISQGERLCTRSVVLMSTDEPDFIRHSVAAPSLADPHASADVGHGLDGWEIRIVGDVDISDPSLVGPAELEVWTRFQGAPDDPVLGQALLAYATDGFLIATAMRPHPGVGQAQAHVSLSTGVLSHTLTFHEPFSAGEWLLLSHRSPYAGHGRCYGRADIFRQDGTLVASFVQDGMIRPLDQSSGARL